jgi:uncharacterized repeat protein (TIGR03847 family)
MAVDDLGPAEKFAAGAIGLPGQRRFYLEVVAAGRRHSLLAEKDQIAVLASQGLAILDRAGISSDEAAVEQIIAAGLEVEDPGVDGERFRVGEISIALAPSELLTVGIASADEEHEDAVSFVIAPEQFRAMARVALEVVAAGRPTCPWCRLPMDPAGHECPARNGHRSH